MENLRKALAWGREFLNRADLRVLNSLPLLPDSGQHNVAKQLIETTLTTDTERECMYEIFFGWQDYIDPKNKEVAIVLREVGEDYVTIRDNFAPGLDKYRGCYDSDGILTERGLLLRMETRNG